jgi:ketosteroid isomerase-like protein
MKKLSLILPLVFLFCITFGCQQGEEAAEEPIVDVEADIAAIKALNDEWIAMYNAGDFEKLTAVFFAENAVQMPPNEPIIEGKDAILSSMSNSREVFEEHCDSSIIEDVSVSGDLAVARGRDTGTMTSRDGGEPTSYDIKWLCAYERQSDGTWKCFYEIWNDNYPLPQPLTEKE